MMPSALSKRWRTSRHKKDSWTNALRQVVQDLQELTSSSEKEFLGLGNHLQDFHRRAREMSQISSHIAERLAGSEMDKGIDGLRDMLDHVNDHHSQSSSSTSLLSSLMARFDDIRLNLGSFDRPIRNLHALCSMIRIESARLGENQSDFSTLSDEIRQLAVHMTKKSGELKERLDTMTRLTRTNLDCVKEFETKEQGQVRIIVEKTTQHLNTIVQKHDLSLAMINETSDQWKAISSSIGEVVTSLQFHDITRQRMEHVGHALGELQDELATASPSLMNRMIPLMLIRKNRQNEEGEKTPPKSGTGMAAISCELQIAQLKHAEEDLSAAIERIKRNLQKIATDVIRMSVETLRATGDDSDEDRSFLYEVEQGLSLLIEAISGYGEIHARLTASMKEVTDTIGEMTLFVREIEKIGFNMKLIALNACIKAAGIGSEGLSLGVLAESIQQISDDTTHDILKMSGRLTTVIDDISGLSVDERSYSSAKSLADLMEERITAIMTPLKGMDVELRVLLNQLRSDSSSFSAEMEQIVEGLSEHDILLTGICRTESDMKRLLGEMKASLKGSERHHVTHDELSIARSRYTMEKEREIHDSIMMGPKAAVAASVAVPLLIPAPEAEAAMASDSLSVAATAETGDAQDLGDNVELF